ncbi:synaptobrevin homolog YKT6-like [Saccoglossus kowalevskii]|uniref:Synaptobrevin homolog YKT6-like n=1 Tax=Saccoglossus kowalevskii TaxID=10224 RepID=A0ABM0GVH1_SACKO|nr:PREDICTED: synaptobrevin homolog YKT6-like [Saccoglossus kowalevskii]
MKIFALSILHKGVKVTTLKAAYDLSSFGYFQKSSVQEFMKFTSQIIVERTQVGRASVKQEEYMCHVYVRADSLSGVLICDHEYPQRVSFTLLNKVLDQFATEIPPHLWQGASEKDVRFEGLDGTVAKYQNPKEADAMTKVQAELDETKIIMHNTIEAVLQRGEKLDDLVDKSADLSMQSKTFYKTARKTNQCCVIL